ncbi:MAG: type IV pilus modification PilV family protein [Candidatus Rifleibacteriota bacterium]
MDLKSKVQTKESGVTLVEILVASCVILIAILPLSSALNVTSNKIQRGVNHFQSQVLINELCQQLLNISQSPGYEAIIPSPRDLKKTLEALNGQLSDTGLKYPQKLCLSGSNEAGLSISPLPEGFFRRTLLVTKVLDNKSSDLSQDWYKITIKVAWNETADKEVERESYLFVGVKP